MPTQYTIDGTAEFYNTSLNDADINIAKFFDTSKNVSTGSVATAEFNDSTENQGVITSSALFAGSSINKDTAVINNPTTKLVFADDATNEGSIGSTQVVFTGNAINTGSVDAAVFTGSSKNQGQVTTAKFVDNAINDTAGSVLIGTYQVPGNNLGTTTTVNEFTQGDGAYTYGYYSSGEKTAPVNNNTTAYEAEDVAGLYFVYDNTGGVVSLADGMYVEGGTTLTRYFRNGVKTTLNRISLHPATWNGSSITPATNYYYYTGSLTSGSVQLYTNASLTTKPNGTFTGTDSINGTSSNWSINSQGVLSWSAVPSSYSTVTIQGTTYYYSGTGSVVPGTTVMYDDTALTTIATAITFDNQTDQFNNVARTEYISIDENGVLRTWNPFPISNGANYYAYTGSLDNGTTVIYPIDPYGVFTTPVANTSYTWGTGNSVYTDANGTVFWYSEIQLGGATYYYANPDPSNDSAAGATLHTSYFLDAPASEVTETVGYNYAGENYPNLHWLITSEGIFRFWNELPWDSGMTYYYDTAAFVNGVTKIYTAITVGFLSNPLSQGVYANLSVTVNGNHNVYMDGYGVATTYDVVTLNNSTQVYIQGPFVNGSSLAYQSYGLDSNTYSSLAYGIMAVNGDNTVTKYNGNDYIGVDANGIIRTYSVFENFRPSIGDAYYTGPYQDKYTIVYDQIGTYGELNISHAIISYSYSYDGTNNYQVNGNNNWSTDSNGIVHTYNNFIYNVNNVYYTGSFVNGTTVLYSDSACTQQITYLAKSEIASRNPSVPAGKYIIVDVAHGSYIYSGVSLPFMFGNVYNVTWLGTLGVGTTILGEYPWSSSGITYGVNSNYPSYSIDWDGDGNYDDVGIDANGVVTTFAASVVHPYPFSEISGTYLDYLISGPGSYALWDGQTSSASKYTSSAMGTFSTSYSNDENGNPIYWSWSTNSGGYVTIS